VLAAGPLVVKADGILAFPLHTAPVFVVLYLGAGVLWFARRRPAAAGSKRWRTRALVES